MSNRFVVDFVVDEALEEFLNDEHIDNLLKLTAKPSLGKNREKE